MADTEATCVRLQQLGIHGADAARDIILRVKQEMGKLPLRGQGGDDKEAQMLARWRYNAAVRGAIQNYRARSQSPPPASLTGADEEFFRAQQYAKHLPTCPECKGKNLEPAALQTRSADEGPSIYMKCISCNKIVRPTYVK
jgi:DNA-directed RNA polymerase subunit M/transcription elongation factor TFIIS